MAKTDPAQELRHRIFTLTSSMEEPLDQARAFAHALDLMGLGLHNIDDDLAAAVVNIAEAMTGQIAVAKKTWQQIMAASRTPKRRRRRNK